MLFSITLISLDASGNDGVIGPLKSFVRDVYSPIQSATDVALEPVRNVVGGIRNYDAIKEENLALRRELDEARGRALLAADAERERAALIQLNGLSSVTDIPRVAARVVAESPGNFQRAFSIDKGTSDGVAVGMPVVDGSGLVGRVIDVSDRQSTVLLVTDAASSVSARNSRTGVVGLANGGGSGQPMELDLIAPNTDMKPGDVIVTSGLEGSIYPPGIPIAGIESATTSPGALQADVQLVPVVNFAMTEFVNVLLWTPAASSGG
jgi:rod shape-determining protein MreC